MEYQHHKLTTASGHENHGPHLCHKCGWPFPNAHPSARHRRAHKKVCGKIEGFKLSESETADNSTHSAVSDDEHHSDGDHRTPSPNGKMTSAKSYRSEDETFSDAVTEFSDSGISPGMEEHPESVKTIEDELLKAYATGGTLVNDPESLESTTDEPVAAESLGTNLDRPIDASPIISEIPVDASLQEMNATESIEAKQVQMSSGQPNDLKGMEDINAGEGLVNAVEASVEVSQSVVSDTDEKTTNNESYESKPEEAEGNFSSPSIVKSKLLEEEEQATDSVPIGAKLQHKETENPDSAYLKLDLPEADVKALDVVNVDKEHEQISCCIRGGGISTQLSPISVSKADSSNEIDGATKMELSEEGREDVHVLSLSKDLSASDNPELLKDFKDYNKFKSSLPLDLSPSEEIFSAKDDAVAASEVSTLDVSWEQVSEEKLVVSAEGKTDSIGLASDPKTFECGLSSIQNSNGLKESEDSLKNSLPSVTPADLSDMNTVISSEAKQTTKVDDPVIERTEETSFTMAEENKGAQTENELFGNKETALEDTICLSEANQTMVTVEGIDHDEHEKARIEHPIVAEEKLAGVSEGDKTIYPVGGHNDRAIVTDTATVRGSREEIFLEASEDSTISNDAKALESASAIGLDSKIISDSDVKEGLLIDTDLNNHVVENSHAGDVLKSATGVISSASQNEGNDKFIKSAVDTPMTSSSRADSLDANWGSVSGRKKNEEIIAKVTNWSGTGKQHTPLKNLLGEARSPNTKQVPKKDETASTKTTTVNSILCSEAAPTKEAEKEWTSPARYPVDIKKEKRKTKPYWVPFVCCSSVHQDA